MTDADLDAIVAGRPDAVVFPKAEGGPSVVHLDAKLTAREAIAGVPEGHIKILAQAVESAAGLFAAGNFRNASPRLIGLTWGPEDLSAELGAETNRDAQGELTEPYRLARSVCLYAAAAAKVPAIETVYVDFRNSDGLRRDTEAARRDGFTGRLAIHPAQVPVINEVFTPTAAEIERPRPWSQRLRHSPARVRSVSMARCMTARTWSRAQALAGKRKGLNPTTCRLSSDRTAFPRRGIRASPNPSVPTAQRDKSTSAGRCGKRPRPPARP